MAVYGAALRFDVQMDAIAIAVVFDKIRFAETPAHDAFSDILFGEGKRDATAGGSTNGLKGAAIKFDLIFETVFIVFRVL